MRPALLMIALMSTLAACGADGPPEPPTKAQTGATGISISGEGRFGVQTRL